jgi:tetrahydromethanopterin S-methyltransferase subunit G
LRSLSLGRSQAAPAENAVSDAAELGGAERRELEKRLKAIERSIEKVAADEVELHGKMATHDQGDYAGLAKLASEQSELNSKRDELELEWLEITDKLG